MAKVLLCFSSSEAGVVAALHSLLAAKWTVASLEIPERAEPRADALPVVGKSITASIETADCFVLLWSTASEQWLRDNLGRLRPNVSLNVGLTRRLLRISPVYDADLSHWSGDPNDDQVVAALRAISNYVPAELQPEQKAYVPTDGHVSPTGEAGTSPSRHSSPRTEEAPDTQTAPTLQPHHRTQQSAGRLFLCYRRDDAADAAGRLHDRLVASYSADRVFMDIDSVPLGVNFITHINQQLQGCAAVLVMIGRSWIGITDAEGNRRLNDPADHVRLEVATALKQGVPVIPILVQNSSMPRATDLPEDIRDLAFYNGIKLSPEFWRAGVERLIKELDRVMKG